MKQQIMKSSVATAWLLFLALTGLLTVPGAQAQSGEAKPAAPKKTEDEAATLFVTDKVWTVHLTLMPEAWKGLEPDQAQMPFGRRLGPPPANAAPPAPGAGPRLMRMPEIDFPEVRAGIEFEGEKVGEIGIRYKGNSSFMGAQGSLKKSFKLDFNQFDKKLRFYGLTKLNLNNNFADASQMRESLSYEIFRAAGVPAPRTSYARVYVSVPGEYERRYLGLYTIVEQVDDRFLQRNFGTKKGLLLKPELPAGMPYLGEDGKVYETAYDAKENVTPEELQRLAAFTKLLNQAEDKTFAEQIRSFMNVNAFVRFLALNALLANGDSILAMGHNYYLYHESKEEQFYWLPWDLNMSFAGFPMGGSATQQMELSLLHPHAGENKLIDRLLALPDVRKAYLAECQRLLDTVFRADKLNERIAVLEAALRSAVKEESAQALLGFERAMQNKLPEKAEGKAEEVAFAPPPPPLNTNAAPSDALFDRIMFARPGGPRPLGVPMGGVAPPLKPFIAGRIAAAQAQLAGKSAGYTPQRGGFGRGPASMLGMRGGPDLRIFGGPGELLAASMLKGADANQDGKLTASELNTAATRWFAQWADKSKQTVDAAALAQGLSHFIQAPPDMPAPPTDMMSGGGPASFIASGFLQVADANHDQQLTAAEFKEIFSRHFNAWDDDKNQTLDQAELAGGLSVLVMPPPGFVPVAPPAAKPNE